MKSGTKKRLAAGLTAGAMMLTIASPALAQSADQVNTGNPRITVVDGVQLGILNIDTIQVVNVEDSLNNNRVLNNSLNNFLNNNDIDVTILQNFLNANDVDVQVGDIEAIRISGTTLLIFV